MQYSKKMMDHCENPRNVGSLDENDKNVGTGLVGSPACGDMLKFQLKIKNGKIVDVKFKTFGCGGAIASSSLTTEKIKGKTIKEALAVKNVDVAKELELPPAKFHCSVMAERAIREAVKDYEEKQVVSDKES